METKKYKSNKALLFLKKNIYLILMVICILAIGTLITLTAIGKNKDNGNPIDTILDANGNPVNSNKSDGDKDKEDEDKDTIAELVFALPIEGEVIKDYTDTELVYDSTMKHWSAHQGIDYSAPVATAVSAVESGTVSSISTTSLRGTTVTIKHKNGFDSSYCLLGPNVAVSLGQEVSKGDTIGYIAETGVFEIADGPHLHFELRLNNVLIDPNLYFDEANK